MKPDEQRPEGQGEPGDDEAAAEAAADEERNAPPTTRSKTAPLRQTSPSPAPNPAIKRGVMTLSDVYAARAVLAEKANQHWAKGLGGGQNREGETIVNFLYKNKVGHSECSMLRLTAMADGRPPASRLQPGPGSFCLTRRTVFFFRQSPLFLILRYPADPCLSLLYTSYSFFFLCMTLSLQMHLGD